MLRALRERTTSIVEPVGVVERRWHEPAAEGAGAVITEYAKFAFT